jgi:hypothetical protein
VPLWLIIVLAVLALLIVGGFLARQRQLKRTRPAFERRLAQVERDLAAAAATDRGWDREHLEAAARAIATQRLGREPEQLTLIEVIDKPGTEDDQAVFLVDEHERLILGRRDGDWIDST